METLTPDQQNIALINQNLDLRSDHGEPVVSRASKLATELAAEKRRLQQDLRGIMLQQGRCESPCL